MESNDNFFTEVSRRNFVKGIGAVAIGAGLIGASPFEALASPMVPKRGGTLRVGVVGDVKDILDAQYIVSIPDIVRLNVGFESFMSYDDNFQPVYEDSVSEEVTAKSASSYVIRVKKGIEFHNGKTVTAADLAYSWKRLADPSLKGTKSIRPFLNPDGVTKIDNRTVQLNLLQPNADFKTVMCSYGSTLVPDGYQAFSKDPVQIGTGPFKLQSFTPGVGSTHVRHANYWDTGKPYFNEVQVLSFADTTALTNALQGGQIDAAINVPLALLPTLKKNKKLDVYTNSAGKITPICLVIDQAPFNDVRVRRAMKLLINRKKLIKQVLSGNGTISNDDYSPADPNYNANAYPQQEQDIPGALKLLKDAGYSPSNPVTFDLKAPDDDAALSGLAKAFAEQVNTASGGVVKCSAVTIATGYWSKEYMGAGEKAFMTYYNPKPYFPQFAGMVFTYPETHFPEVGSTIKDDYFKALATVSPAKRKAIIAKMQKEEHERGGYIIPYFVNAADAFNTKLQGVVKRRASLPLDTYGRHFKNLWFK